LLLIALSALIVAVALSFVLQPDRLAAPIGKHTSQSVKVPAFVRSLRPNFPYSVIPGGAYSQSELRFASQNDSLVREHYLAFDISSTRLVTLTADRYQYVSYRVHDQIYWTKRRLRIPKGEILLTDGRHYARSRCGNRLSNTPQQPTANLEPPEAALNLPSLNPGQTYNFQLAPSPPKGELQQQFPAPSLDVALAPLLQKGNEPQSPIFMPWTGLNQFFPVAFAAAPGMLPLTPNSVNRNNFSVLPVSEITNIDATSTPPTLLLIPEPATIGSLAAAMLFFVSFILLRRLRVKPSMHELSNPNARLRPYNK
jgi:hypothetical protein